MDGQLKTLYNTFTHSHTHSPLMVDAAMIGDDLLIRSTPGFNMAEGTSRGSRRPSDYWTSSHRHLSDSRYMSCRCRPDE